MRAAALAAQGLIPSILQGPGAPAAKRSRGENRDGNGLHTLKLMIESGCNGNEEETLGQIMREAECAGISLQVAQYKQLKLYLSLILRWNTRINLTAIRDPGGMIERHLIESVACALALPPGIATLLDFGSGAGLPGIPIAICRPAIAVLLAESQTKKAAFLREAIRVIGLNTRVHADRAETLTARFDCVALRAVDRMERSLASARALVASQGWLAVMTSIPSLSSVKTWAGVDLDWSDPVKIPGGEQRVLLLGRSRPSAPIATLRDRPA